MKTSIRSNFLGEGSFKHRAAEFVIGLFTPSPESYASRVVPLLVAPELDQRTALMFGAKATPIFPTDGLTEAHVSRFLAVSEGLIDRALR